jgi:hypothetical protein
MGSRVDGVPGQPSLGPSVPSRPLSKPLHPKGLRLVLVRWHDAWFDFEHGTSDWRDDYLVETVGFLVRQDPGVISLAQELLPGRDGFRAVTHIPTGVVESIITLAHDDGAGRRAADRALRASLQEPTAIP